MSEPSVNAMRQTLRSMSTGVYILSVHAENADEYLVVSLAMQCSVAPPRIAFALTPSARIVAALRNARSGVLTVLGDGDLAAIRRYGAPGGVRNMPANPARTTDGHPIPPEARRWLTLALVDETVVGDHVLFVASVTGAGIRERMESGADAVSEASAQHSSPDSPAVTDAARSGDTFRPLTLAATGFPYAG